MNRYIRQSVQALRAYTPGEQPGDARVVKLNTNENPYPPSPAVQQALASLEANALRLYPDPESRGLRRRIAELHGCALAQVFAGNGSDEILALGTRAFVENDGAIGYFDPSYSLYPVLAQIRGVATRPLALGPRFEWTMPADYTAALFFLANPNAPTGILYPKKTVGAFCRKFPGVVLIDEAYVDFARTDCLDLALKLDNVLVMRTLSKSYSLAGIRLGYVVGPQPLIEALFKIKDSYNLDRLTQALALAALNDQAWMKANIKKIQVTRARLAAALKHLKFQVFSSETNFLWVKPPQLKAEALYRRLRAQDILVRYFPGPRTGAYLRITVGTDEQIDILLAALRRLLG